MINTIDLTICIYFKINGDINPLRNIVELTDKWSIHVNKKIEYLSYTLVNDKAKQVSKNVKFNEKNLNALYQIEGSGKLKNVGLINLTDNAYLRSRDTDLSMLFSYPREIFDLYSLIFHFNTDVLNIKDNKGLFTVLEELFSLLENINAFTVYGIVFPMERTKFPALYASGISSQELTEVEKYKSYLWGNYSNQCKEKVWEVFWGNILTKEHLGSDNITIAIKNIVGEDNVKQIFEDVFIITYPLNVFTYKNEKNKFNIYHDQLTALFEQYNLIITG
jgi:hypothetical protein